MKKLCLFMGCFALILTAGCYDGGDETTSVEDCRSESVTCPLGQACIASIDGFSCQDPMNVDSSGGVAPPTTNIASSMGDDESANAMDANESDPLVLQPNGDSMNEGESTNESEAMRTGMGNNGSDMPENTDASATESPVGDGCRAVTLRLKPSRNSVPRFIVVVDRSGSMIDERLWSPLVNTLSMVLPELEDVISFGLMLFPDPTPPAGLDLGIPESTDLLTQLRYEERIRACAPGEVDISPALNNSAPMIGLLDTYPARSGMGTPTAPSLAAAGEALADETSMANTYILLATDGGPGCNFALDYQTCDCLLSNCFLEMPENCMDEQRSVSVINALADRGVRTFVLGITSDNLHARSVAVLDAMAEAGQTAVDGRHLAVGAGDELLEQLRQTAGSVAPCEYDLESLSDEIQRLIVAVDDELVERDESHANGWDVVDDQLVFYGDACLGLRDGRAHRITAGCP